MSKKMIAALLRRPASVVMVILAVVVFGVSSLRKMPMEYLPDMDMPMQLVIITWPGADADGIDRLVAQPVEDKCQTLTDIDSVNCLIYDNYVMIQLTYHYGADMDDAASDLRSAMDNMMQDLPDGCNDPQILELSADYFPTMVVSASGEGIDVAAYLDDSVVPELESLNGVAMVEMTGTQEEYMRIVLDETAMKQNGLSLASVGAAIAAADFDMPVGSVKIGSQDVSFEVRGTVDIDSDFRDLPIATPYGRIVHLRDICTFYGLYHEEAESVSRFNGNDSVLLQVTKQDSAATVATCRDIMKSLERHGESGIHFEPIYNEADSIIETLKEVLKTLLTGVFLTMLVLYVFFGDWRASLIVAISMPLSILLAVILLGRAGYAIDLMTGSALIIAIGMIVDNSIVILESCMRAKSEEFSFQEAAAEGTSSMIMSTLAGTLTTVVVYIPLAMAEGMTGMMSAPLSWTILLSMLASFICAVIVVPLAFTWLKPHEKEELPVNRILERIRTFYRRVMPGLLKRPARIVAVGALCFVGAIALMTQMRFVLIPDNYDGSIKVTAILRAGTRLEVISERIKPLEDALRADDGFDRVTLTVEDNTASLTAYAAKSGRRSSEEAVALYTEAFRGIPGMDVTVEPTSDMNMTMLMPGNGKKVILLGSDMERLRRAANLTAEELRRIDGVNSVNNPFDLSKTKGKVMVNSQKAMALGTSEQAIAGQIHYLLEGMTAAETDVGDSQLDIKVEYPEGKYSDITALLDYPIMTQSGRQVALRELADVEYVSVLPSINRQDGDYMVTLDVNVDALHKNQISDRIDGCVSTLILPEGVAIGRSTMDRLNDDEIEHAVRAIVTAAFLVFLVMAIQFDSPRLSVMVMMCLPLSLIGSVALVFMTGRPMSLTGLMGFLMLIGIAVNNGIYLVDGVDQLRKTMPLGQALVEAGTTRLRPILMTTLTTAISMLPMIFSSNSGMSMMKDMAYIVIGGLIASTVLALFLMPAFYLLIRGERIEA